VEANQSAVMLGDGGGEILCAAIRYVE